MTGRATKFDFRASPRIVSRLAENTNSNFGDGSSELETANGCPVLKQWHHLPSSESAQRRIRPSGARSPERATDYMDAGYTPATFFLQH